MRANKQLSVIRLRVKPALQQSPPTANVSPGLRLLFFVPVFVWNPIMKTMRRLWPLALLLAALGAAWRLGLASELSWESLGRHQAALRAYVGAHPVLSPALYIGLYAAAVAVSLPVGALMTAAGGLFFGPWLGGAAAVAGATLGAASLFLIVRYALAGMVERKAGALIARVRPRLERDGFSYLLAMRLLPIVPFWLTNLAPALTGMRLAPYVLATLIGIAPATFVFAGIGAGLADVLAAGRRPDLSAAFAPGVLLPLAGLAALSLAPVAWRALRRPADA
jgi:uncharacterized membrane protein YdjX (TVP38/TMEM64 family)